MNEVVQHNAERIKPKVMSAVMFLANSGGEISVGKVAARSKEHPSIVAVTLKLLAEEGEIELDTSSRTVRMVTR
jgi:DNA-binding MarR family transcriptional regulator